MTNWFFQFSPALKLVQVWSFSIFSPLQSKIKKCILHENPEHTYIHWKWQFHHTLEFSILFILKCLSWPNNFYYNVSWPAAWKRLVQSLLSSKFHFSNTDLSCSGSFFSFNNQTSHESSLLSTSPSLIHSSVDHVCLWPYPALKLPSLRSNIFLADKSHISHPLLNLGSHHPLTQLATPSGNLSLALASWGLLPLCQLILKIHLLCSSTSLPKALLFSHLIHRSWVVSFFSHVGHLRNPAQTLPSIQYKS